MNGARWMAAIAMALCWVASARSADSRQRFLSEAPPAWAAYREYVSHLRGSRTTEQSEAGKLTLVAHARLLVDLPRARIEWDNGNGVWSADCANSVYSFAVQRTSPEGHWFLLRPSAPAAGPIDGPLSMSEAGLLHAAAALQIENRLISDLCQLPGFRLKEVAADATRPDWVAIGFDYLPMPDKHPSPRLENNYPVRGGRVLLDPHHDWVVREYEVRGEWGDPRNGGEAGTIRVRIDYGDEAEPHLLPVKLTQSINAGVAGQPATELVRTTVFDFRHVDSIPESEFTLSAFGLPEPGQVAARGRSWWVPVAVLGALMLILAGYFYQQSRASA